MHYRFDAEAIQHVDESDAAFPRRRMHDGLRIQQRAPKRFDGTHVRPRRPLSHDLAEPGASGIHARVCGDRFLLNQLTDQFWTDECNIKGLTGGDFLFARGNVWRIGDLNASIDCPRLYRWPDKWSIAQCLVTIRLSQ